MIARKWLVLFAVSAIAFFASAATFQSMGIAIFAMANEFRWSQAEAGGAFLSLGIVCAATSLLPVATIPRIGARWTIVAGGMILGAGFLLAAAANTLLLLYGATALFGFGFSLLANTSGIFLIASWFDARAPRMIGLYLMCGTISGAAGPLVTSALVAGSWRLHWLTMAALAFALSGLCAILIQDPPAIAAGESGDDNWQTRGWLKTPQFLGLAMAMVATQTCLITVSGIITPHLVRLGWTSGFAARMLALQAFVGTLATGVSGWLGERHDPRLLVTGGLLAQATGMLLLAFAADAWINAGFAVAFGIGTAAAGVAVTILLIRYFGNRAGSAALSAIWMLCGIATAGPSAAGMVADATGSFAPALVLLGLLLFPAAVGTMFMGAPGPRFAAAESSQE